MRRSGWCLRAAEPAEAADCPKSFTGLLWSGASEGPGRKRAETVPPDRDRPSRGGRDRRADSAPGEPLCFAARGSRDRTARPPGDVPWPRALPPVTSPSSGTMRTTPTISLSSSCGTSRPAQPSASRITAGVRAATRFVPARAPTPTRRRRPLRPAPWSTRHPTAARAAPTAPSTRRPSPRTSRSAPTATRSWPIRAPPRTRPSCTRSTSPTEQPASRPTARTPTPRPCRPASSSGRPPSRWAPTMAATPAPSRAPATDS